MIRPRTNSWAFVLAVLWSALPVPAQSIRPVKQIRYLMGTLCEITVYPSGPANDAATARAIAAAFSELKRIESVLSNWDPDSELMRLNQHAGAEGDPRPRVRISDELFERLQVALRIARQSDGFFDPTVGSLVRAWGFLPRCQTKSPCPTQSRSTALAAARRKVGWQKVTLLPETREVEFAEPGMEVDLGGIAKGYAAERAAQVLKEHGIRAALVNLGSSSLKALGVPPACESHKDNCAWAASIADPRNRRRSVAEILLHDGDALATSGTYEKSIGKGKQRRSHLINPLTGEALGGLRSVSLICTNAEAADALTKPFILSNDWNSVHTGAILRDSPRCGVVRITVKNGTLLGESVGVQIKTTGRMPVYSRATAQVAGFR